MIKRKIDNKIENFDSTVEIDFVMTYKESRKEIPTPHMFLYFYLYLR